MGLLKLQELEFFSVWVSSGFWVRGSSGFRAKGRLTSVACKGWALQGLRYLGLNAVMWLIERDDVRIVAPLFPVP